jgi:hypothetical protein
MPLGIVDDSEFNLEVSRISPSISSTPNSTNTSNNNDGNGAGRDNSRRDNRENGEADRGNEQTAVVVDKLSPGRKENDRNVPKGLRKIIGEEGIVNGRRASVDLAKEFGISHDSADAYRKGATSLATYNQSDQALTSHLTHIKEGIARKATSRLDSALESITPEKLEDIKPRDAAGIAKDMSVIIRNMEPEVKEGMKNIGPNYIYYSPRSHKEEDYETVEVPE